MIYKQFEMLGDNPNYLDVIEWTLHSKCVVHPW